MVHRTAIKFTCKYNSHVRDILQCHQHKFSLVSSFYVLGSQVVSGDEQGKGEKIKLSCTRRPQRIQAFSYLFSCYFITDFGLVLLRIRLPLLPLWYIKTLPEKWNVDKHKFYFRCFKRQNRKCMFNLTLRTCWCNNSCRGQQICIIYSEFICSISYLVCMRMRGITLSSVGLFGCIIYFHNI